MSERILRPGVAAAIALCLLMPALPACASAGEADRKVEADADLAAEIGGQKITLREADEYIRKSNPRGFQQIYDMRRAAVEQMIAERLMAAEAASRSVTPAALREQISSSPPAVTDAQIEAWYNANRARLGGRTLDQARGQIRGFLGTQAQQRAMSDFLGGLRQKMGVRILLEVPRADVKIAATDPWKGPKEAPVQIVEFSDFQ